MKMITKKPQHKKHIRMIEFEPANDFQEECGLNMVGACNIALIHQLQGSHQKNKFTVKYMTKDDAEKPHKSIS